MAVSTLQDDKKKALNLAIAQIEKSCGKGSIMRLGAADPVRIDCIPTGAINLDAAPDQFEDRTAFEQCVESLKERNSHLTQRVQQHDVCQQIDDVA